MDLELPLNSDTKHAYPERHLRLQTCQNIISSILEATQCIPLAIEQRYERIDFDLLTKFKPG